MRVVRRSAPLAVAAAVVSVMAATPGIAVAQPQAQLGHVTLTDNIVAYTFTLGATATLPDAPLRIRPGDSIVWRNLDPFSHNVSFMIPVCTGCSPFYAYLPHGTTASLTFPRAGYYRYLCTEHPQFRGMHGLVYVSPSARV